MKKRVRYLDCHKVTRYLSLLCFISSILMAVGCRTFELNSAISSRQFLTSKDGVSGGDFDKLVLKDVIKEEIPKIHEWSTEPYYYGALNRAGFIRYVRAKRIVCRESEDSLRTLPSQGMTMSAFPISRWWRSAQMRAFVLENLKAITSLEDFRKFNALMDGVDKDWWRNWRYEELRGTDEGILELKRVLELVYQEKLKLLQAGEFEKFKEYRHCGDSETDDWKLLEATLLVGNDPDQFKKMIAFWEDKLKAVYSGLNKYVNSRYGYEHYRGFNAVFRVLNEEEKKGHLSDELRMILRIYKQLNRCGNEILVKSLQMSPSAIEESVLQKSMKEIDAWLAFWKKYPWLDISLFYAVTLGEAAKAQNTENFCSWVKYWEKVCPEVLDAREDEDTGARDSDRERLYREKPSKLLDLDLIRLHLNDEYNARCEYSQWNIQEFVRVYLDHSGEKSEVGVPISLAREAVVAIEANNVELLSKHLQLENVSYYVVDGPFRSTRKVAKSVFELGVQVGNEWQSRNAILYALENGSIEVADWLYENGADLPKVDNILYEKTTSLIKCIDWLIANSTEKGIPSTAFDAAIRGGYVESAELIRKQYGLKVQKSYAEYLKYCAKPVEVVTYLSTTCGLKIKDQDIGQLLTLHQKEWGYSKLSVEVFAKLLMSDGVDVNGYAQKNFKLDMWQVNEVVRKFSDRDLNGFADYLESIGVSMQEANEIEGELRSEFAKVDEADRALLTALSLEGGMGAAFAAGAKDGKEKSKRNLLEKKLIATIERLDATGKLKPNSFEFNKVEVPLLFAVVETFGDEGLPLVEMMIKHKVTLPCIKVVGEQKTELKEYAQGREDSCRKVLGMLRKAERGQ